MKQADGKGGPQSPQQSTYNRSDWIVGIGMPLRERRERTERGDILRDRRAALARFAQKPTGWIHPGTGEGVGRGISGYGGYAVRIFKRHPPTEASPVNKYF